jgi:multidrug resistance efflux pump
MANLPSLDVSREEELVQTPNLIGAADPEAFPEPVVPQPTDLPKESGFVRALRIGIAIPLLALSCFALAPFSIMPTSSQAVVNARLSTIEAAMNGQVGDVTLETGDRVQDQQVLARLGPSPLQHQGSYSDSGDTLLAESAHVDAALAAGEDAKARYDAAYEAYLRRSIDDLNLKLDEASHALSQAQVRLNSSNEDLSRDRQALRDHLISKAVPDHDNEIVEQNQEAVDTATNEVAHIRKQLSDLRSGFVPLNGSGVPTIVSQRDQAINEVDQMRQEKNAVARRMAQAAADRKSGNLFASGPLPIQSPVSGIIWARSVATGQIVQEGDDLFHIADENSIHVELWMDRRYGPQLSVGDPALIYLSGLGKEFYGRISSFEGTSHRRLDEKINAIDLQAVHPDQYHVTIELDTGDRKVGYIGQAAKVLFPGTKHPLRARIYFWLTRL